MLTERDAFIESWHKTLKYTVGYPAAFTSITQARAWFADFVDRYNERHLHSGLDYVTPMQAHTGGILTNLPTKKRNPKTSPRSQSRPMENRPNPKCHQATVHSYCRRFPVAS